MRFLVLLAAAAAIAVPAAARADQAPLRHLVYNFDITLTSDLEMQSYDGTGNRNYSTGDRGQIVVDVIAKQPDTGLVVRISENARGTRSADPAMCVTYGNGEFVCDPNKKVNEEEVALLRLLGRNFIDQAQIDAKNNWSITSSRPDASETSSFHIDGSKDGILNISMTRNLTMTGAQPSTAQTTGKIVYDEKMTVPDSETEMTVTRQQTGMTYNRLEQQIGLSLVTDSMQAQAAKTH